MKKLMPRPIMGAGRRIARLLVGADSGVERPVTTFHAESYTRHNQRRQEHLASLGLPIAGASVLEVAAGIGDHTTFFLDRGCTVVSTEARAENLALLRQRYPSLDVRRLDLDNAVDLGRSFEIIYCYGTLYHLQRPAEALAFMAGCCRRMLLLETCVSYGDHQAVNLVDEVAGDPTQSVVGHGCRPTRPWIHHQLRRLFDHVYIPRTQPNHEEFPLDWTKPPDSPGALTRAVFIASRQPLENRLLTEELLVQQVRQG
jgi:ubiquinone/menaquinone biosynthesis C-methylase UbiE